MLNSLRQFCRDESGAVTVDWVVLTALCVTLLAAGYGNLESAAVSTSTSTSTYMSNRAP